MRFFGICLGRYLSAKTTYMEQNVPVLEQGSKKRGVCRYLWDVDVGDPF
jgi:hypothetical protein